MEEGRARIVPVDVARNNGQLAALVNGPGEGTEVILYPSDTLVEGVRVERRAQGE